MADSLKTGLMAVFAVSGSVVVLAMHAHNRLLSQFFHKMEFQIKNSSGDVNDEPKKRVRFADDVARSTIKKAHRKNPPPRPPGGGCRNNDVNFGAMPQNWQVLYKGILQSRRV